MTSSADQNTTTAASESTPSIVDPVATSTAAASAATTAQDNLSATDPVAQVTDTTQPKTDQQKAQTNNKIKKILIALIILGLIALVAFGLWKSYQPKWIELQGRVEAETLHVSTKLPSRIEEIMVKDGDTVSKGQILVRLHSPEIDAKKQQAQASLQAALALQSTTERGAQQENIETLYSNWQSLKAQQVLTETTHKRGANLYKEGVISRQRLDEMQAAAISAGQLTTAAYQQYVRAKRGSTVEQKSTADAQVEIAHAAVNEANALEAETVLLSPINGQVSKTYGKVSEFVGIGVPVVSIIETEHAWVSLNVREDQYAQVYQAKSLDGFIPALNRSATFNISNIEAEGEFATIKTTRQTGGYDIRSFKLHLTPAKPIADLKTGMSVLFKIKAAA